MFGIAARSKISAQPHCDGPGGDFRKAGGQYDVRGGDGAGQPGGQSKRDRQAIGHADDDVAHGFAGGEVLLSVRGLGHKIMELAVRRSRQLPLFYLVEWVDQHEDVKGKIVPDPERTPDFHQDDGSHGD